MKKVATLILVAVFLVSTMPRAFALNGNSFVDWQDCSASQVSSAFTLSCNAVLSTTKVLIIFNGDTYIGNGQCQNFTQVVGEEIEKISFGNRLFSLSPVQSTNVTSSNIYAPLACYGFVRLDTGGGNIAFGSIVTVTSTIGFTDGGSIAIIGLPNWTPYTFVTANPTPASHTYTSFVGTGQPLFINPDVSGQVIVAQAIRTGFNCGSIPADPIAFTAKPNWVYLGSDAFHRQCPFQNAFADGYALTTYGTTEDQNYAFNDSGFNTGFEQLSMNWISFGTTTVWWHVLVNQSLLIQTDTRTNQVGKINPFIDAIGVLLVIMGIIMIAAVLMRRQVRSESYF